MTLSRAGAESGDTLAVPENIYLHFRQERPQDHLREGIVRCLVPGIDGGSPVNETLNAAWKSSK
eukprot:4474592-Lingulodinium_polyedra.AAC.1